MMIFAAVWVVVVTGLALYYQKRTRELTIALDEVLDRDTSIKEFHYDPQQISAKIEGGGARRLQRLISNFFIYGGGKNFIEWVAQVPPGVVYGSLTTPEFVITVQRKGGLTPNDMRERAEKQRDELVEQLVELFGWEDTSYVHASLHVKNAVNNLRADLSVQTQLLERAREMMMAAGVCPVCGAHSGESCDAGLHS